MKAIRSSLLMVLLGWGSVCLAANTATTPTQQVKGAVDEVLGILKNTALTRDTRQAQIRGVIQKRFDFRSMSQSVLGTNWKKASQAEKDTFVSFFSEYLENTYMEAIEAYTDEQVRYAADKIREDRAVVNTRIVTATGEIPVDYRMRLNDGQWYAYDVVIEGVSLVSNYRSVFSTMIQNEGMDGLLKNLEYKLQSYKESKKEAS